MDRIKEFDEKDIYLTDYNDIELDIDIDEIDEIALKRIEKAALNKVKAHEALNDSGASRKKNSLRQWFELQTRIGKAAAIILCLTALCGVTLGCIALIRQYVPGFGIVSESSKLQILASPYTVWKDDYYLRITSLSYNPDTKILSFTAESNGVDGCGYDVGESVVSGGIFFKAKWSQATPFEESMGKRHYNYGNPAAEYHDEYKLKKELGDYYLELGVVDISYDDDGKEVYADKPEHIVISFDEIELVPAEEADGLEDFGEAVESSGISAVPVSRWDKGKLYADLLFESSNPKERVLSFNVDEENSIELVTDDSRKYENVSGKSLSTGWKYLLFETDEPVNGRVSLNSLFIEKTVDKPIKLDMPEVGETKILNREVVVDGITIVLESIKAYDIREYYNGKYVSDVKEIRFELKYSIVQGIYNGRIADDKSHIIGEIKVGNVKNIGKGCSWGPSGLFVDSDFNAEDLKNVSEITLLINDIMLTAEGNWEIPIVVE